MKKGKWLIYFVLILAVAVMTIPFLWMLLTSFKTFEDSTKIPLQILPEQWILTNYTEILEVFPIAKWFMNSILAVVISLLAQVFLGSLAAYAFARLRFPGKKFLFMLMLSIMMIPEQIFIIPRYNTLAAVGLTTWKDMMWPLIVIRDRDKMPVVSGLSTLADYFANKYPQLMAGGVLCSIPVIIFFFVLQKYFVAGIASQGIKE